MQATPTGSDDTAPYFIGESITYVCNNNYEAEPADLTNQCIENTGAGDPGCLVKDDSRSNKCLSSRYTIKQWMSFLF